MRRRPTVSLPPCLGRRAACASVAAALLATLVAAPAPALAGAMPGRLSGTIAEIEQGDFTIQTGGRPTGVINALTDAANAVARQDTPYVWGGGHGEAGVPSRGDIGGPGANGRNIGYDCSGAVAAVLAAAGLWPAGGYVPNDAGVIAHLLAAGLIAPGPGTAPNEVTLYDHPGVHIFMNIDGAFFGTSDGAGGGDRKGGAGWLDDGAGDAHSRQFKQYHFLPAVLKERTTYGQEYTFQLTDGGTLLNGFLLGDKVQVGYRAAAGSMTAAQLSWVGAQSLTGTVTSLGPTDGGLVVQTVAGQTYALDVSDVEPAFAGVQPGDIVKLVYIRAGSTLTTRVLSVTAWPTAETATGTITALAPDQSSLTVETAPGHNLTLLTSGNAAMLTGLAVGTQVQVQYTQWPDGTLFAGSVSPFETSAPGSIQSPTAPGTSPAAAPGVATVGSS